MTLTAHAIVGGAIAAAMPTHPILGIGAAFASHFLIDAIPHYDYKVRSASIHPKKGDPMKYDRALLLDFFSIGTDFALGLLLAFVLFATPATWFLVLVAAFAGQFPDALQFAYTRAPHVLGGLQRFHEWIHTGYRMRGQLALGIVTQVAFLVVFVFVAKVYLFSL